MYLSKVKIRNFRGYGENLENEDKCYVYDDLNAPLVIFKGYNGFGKTSFYEAIEWCLTDNVYRLEKFYDDKTYQANELKKSHYLKFYHPFDGNLSKREIYVELNFSDGLRIIRKSKSNVLRTTQKDTSYQSVVYMGYSKVVEVENEEVLQKFISNAKSMDVFFHTHMLGQESISDFLRHNSPSQRRDLFMQLLQEEELNSLSLAIQKYSNGNVLSKKYSQLDKQVNEHTEVQKGIEQIIKNLKFSNIEEYINSLQDHYLALKVLIQKEKEHGEELGLSSLTIEDEINLDNCVSFLQNVSFSYTKLTTYEENLIIKKQAIKRMEKQIELLNILKEAKTKIQESEHAKKLLDNDYTELKKLLKELKNQRDQTKSAIDFFNNKLKTLSSQKGVFSSLHLYINMQDSNIEEYFWKQFNSDLEEWKKFIVENRKFFKVNRKTNEIDTNWFNSIRKKYDDYKVNLNKKNTELMKIRSEKEKVSSLNREYQKALSEVKNLLIKNPNIDSCPVCLNDDFSEIKYLNMKVEGWDSNSNVADKILKIIDSTYSSGNEQVEELSLKENIIIKEIKGIQELLKKEIFEQLFSQINAIRSIFVFLYQDVEIKLKQDLEDYEKKLDKQQQEHNTTSTKVNKMDESIKILFGPQVSLENIESDKLEQIIKNKEDWFRNSSNQFEILTNTITLTEIENEIAILEDEEASKYTKEEVIASIKNIDSKFDFIKTILSQFHEITKYKLPNEYESSFKEFEHMGNKIVRLKQKQELIEKYRTELSELQGKLLGQQRRVIKERLEKHPIISWVYETINPHPFHKKLHITNTERGTNFIGETQLDDKVELYLDQMFSAAQLNILALSIFLGLGLTQRYSNLQQLFLDDPIQSMDDVNVLALIDVIRAIMDSRYNDKHIVISTHNEDFAQLIAIKMRNRGIVQYSITGYTEEGPKIVKIK
ncbi:AAA family ATPase [Bacillus cereus]|nr:AAA family ATPase [Bacillus cereus]